MRRPRSTPRPVHIRNTETYGALCGAGEKGDRWHLLKFPDSAVKRPVSCQDCLRLAKKTPVPAVQPEVIHTKSDKEKLVDVVLKIDKLLSKHDVNKIDGVALYNDLHGVLLDALTESGYGLPKQDGRCRVLWHGLQCEYLGNPHTDKGFHYFIGPVTGERFRMTDAELELDRRKEANNSVEQASECAHNTMVPNADPEHPWRCFDCGYVYGTQPAGQPELST